MLNYQLIKYIPGKVAYVEYTCTALNVLKWIYSCNSSSTVNDIRHMLRLYIVYSLKVIKTSNTYLCIDK